MNSKKGIRSIPAMAFYHQDGFVPAWKQAIRFAGEGGRIATLPDIINARLATNLGSTAWERYFTTTTAEYLGKSRGGSKIIIVAHGVGPMATLNGICKAYSYEYKDKSRDNRGGRISRDEFLKLESGSFGSVEVVDYNEVVRQHKYPFNNFMTFGGAIRNPLVRARLGSKWKEYIKLHGRLALEFCLEHNHERVDNPIIIKMGDAANCSYEYTRVSDDQAMAHLISIAPPMNVQLSRREYPEAPRGGSLACEVDCHEWWNGVRIAAVRAGVEVTDIHSGVDSVTELLHRNWRLLMCPLAGPARVGFRVLTKIGVQWFTQYPKIGERMDTGEPEFYITSIKKIGDEKVLKTTQSGFPGFFKYGIREAQMLAPQGANAYELVGAGWLEPGLACWRVEFYRVEVDTSQRLIRADELRNDYDTLMKLLEKEDEAA